MFDITPVFSELISLVGEDICHSINKLLPGGHPVTVIFDHHCGFVCTNDKFNVTDLLSSFLFMSDGVCDSKDVVQINQAPCEEVFPLGFEELWQVWQVWGVEKKGLGKLEVPSEILKSSLVFSEGFQQCLPTLIFMLHPSECTRIDMLLWWFVCVVVISEGPRLLGLNISGW